MRFFDSIFGAAEQALQPVSSQKAITTSENEDSKSPGFAIDLQRIKTNETPGGSAALENNSQGGLPVPGRFSKDFDEDPTDLYRFIQMKRWGRALKVIEDSPEEAKIWVYRLNDDHLTVRWRLLPLHAALILKAPDEVIEALLMTYKYSAKMKDDQGSLPLHLICKIGTTKKVAEMLLTLFPKAANVEDGEGRNPVALLALFNPPNKTEILASVKERVDEELEAKAALDAFDRREERHVRDSLESMSIEIPEEEAVAITSRTSGLTAAIEAREPANVSKREREPESMLTKLQEKHKERLIAMKESMDIQNEVTQAGEEISLKTKLEDAQSEHLNELERLRDEANRRFEEARAEEARKLEDRLQEARAKHETQMLEIQMSKTEVESKGNHESELQRIQEEIDSMKRQHEQELMIIKQTAEAERAEARQEEREMFELRLKQFETKHKSIVETIKAESLAEREKTRAAELKNFEKRVETIEKRHQKELKTVEARLMVERETMQEDQRKMFDNKITEIQQKHNKDLQEFQFRLNLAQEEASEERSRILDTKLKELEKKHLVELENIEKKSMATIDGLHNIISSLKEDLNKANANSTKQTVGFNKSLQGLETKLMQSSDKATKKVALLERTVESLEASLNEARKHSIFLEDHVHNLEEQIEERNVKDKELEARLNKMQRTWLCFEFGA